MNYKQVYKKFFKYGEQDIILSEVSGGLAGSIHHIIKKSQGGRDNIENLIALTNREHRQAHRLEKEKFLSEDELTKIHERFMANHISRLF